MWWTSLPPQDKVQWYRKEQSHFAGAKRSLSSVQFEESTTSVAQRSRLNLYNHIPLSVFVRSKFCEGVRRNAAVLQLNAIVSEQREQCVFENGQWHVPDYGGIQTSVGQVDSSGFTASRIADNIRDADTITGLASEATRSVSAATAADNRLMQQYIPKEMPDAGTIARNPATSAMVPEAAHMHRDEIIHEAASGVFWDAGCFHWFISWEF